MIVQLLLEHIWFISIVVNIAAGIGTICFMLAVTDGWHFTTYLGVIKSLHRLTLGILATSLLLNAGLIYDNETPPRDADFAVELAFLGVLLFSGIRHRMAPKHQSTAAVAPHS